MSTDKTLADVQPGGRVRLGDAPWPEIDAILADAYSAGAEGLPFEGIARRAAVRKAVAVLSTQPSPGGQGDALVDTARRNIRQFISKASFSNSVDKQAALSCVDVLEEALSARQPVGEPVAWQVNRTRSGLGWEACTRECYEETLRTGRYMGLPAGARDVEVRALYAAPPGGTE